MSYLLDTNVLSELVRPKPNPNVLQWIATMPDEASHIWPVVDSLIAATALYHNPRLVTRNTRDFQYPSLQVVCPWRSVNGLRTEGTMMPE